MEWLDAVIEEYDFIKKVDDERRSKISIRKFEDIPQDFDGFKYVHVWSDYEGPSPMTFLPGIIAKMECVESLDINCDMSWDDIFSLDLSKVKRLRVSFKGQVGKKAPCSLELKELILYTSNNMAPLEVLATPISQIDFSKVPNIETLSIKGIPRFNPDDFKELKYLKKLTIRADMNDLSWLQNTEYQLRELVIDGPIEDCTGIVNQQTLEKICIYHSYIKNAEIFTKIPGLKLLDLRYGDISYCEGADFSEIEKVIITRHDVAVENLDRNVKELAKKVAIRIKAGEKRVDAIKDKKGKLDAIDAIEVNRAKMSFEKRAKLLLKQEYELRIGEMSKPGFCTHSIIPTEEYIERFSSLAQKYYPVVTE